ncbi:hypothetical protein [uncultured Adlercreutzia sp.]|uniref:hypothetical protein n=1 Tax=uncultured Adlercreutzia sp. TaxID=875803 RepID=UPI0025DFD68F|nr:hypothetical protein [uncultured Adlercreutzia sp.]
MVLFYVEVLCMLAYGGAGALCAYVTARNKPQLGRRAKGLFLGALLLHSAAIGLTSASTHGTLLTGPNIVMLASWVLAVATGVLLVVRRRSCAYAMFTAPAAAALILASLWLGLLSDGANPSNAVYYQWPTLVPHIVLVFLAAACFMVSAAASGLHLYERRLMTRRSARLFSLDAPALDTLAHVARAAALAGLILLTGAMVIGFTRLVAMGAAMSAMGCLGSVSYLNPRIALSLVVWAVYVVYAVLSFLVPYAVGSRVRAAVSIAGFALTVALIAVSAG